MSKLLKLWIYFILIFAIPSQSFAERSFEKFWGLITYTNREYPLYFMIEPQLRLVNLPGGYEQFLLNAGAGLRFSQEIELWFGQTYVNLSSTTAIADDTSLRDRNEYRPWQQILWTHLEKHFQFELRSRLEERYSFDFAPWSLRWRNRLLWIIPIHSSYSLMTSNEFLLNLRSVSWVKTGSFDQNRAFIGILKDLGSYTRISFGYMNQYLTNTPAEDNHALMVNIFIQA